MPHTFAFCANVWEALDSVRKKCTTIWLDAMIPCTTHSSSGDHDFPLIRKRRE